MKKDATFKVGKFTVHVDYYEDGNAIHVSAAVNGKSYWADISELTRQNNEDGSKGVFLDEKDYELGIPNPEVTMTAAEWQRIDEWLTTKDHY